MKVKSSNTQIIINLYTITIYFFYIIYDNKIVIKQITNVIIFFGLIIGFVVIDMIIKIRLNIVVVYSNKRSQHRQNWKDFTSLFA